MRRRAWWTLLVIVILAGLAGMVAWPNDVWFVRGVRFKPGLDIKGGTQLVYQLDTGTLTGTERDDAVAGAQEAIRRRVDAFGVTEPTIYTRQISGVTALDVELPGVSDIAEAKSLIGKTAKLEFWEPGSEDDANARATFFGTFTPTPLDGSKLKRAQVSFQSDKSGVGASEPVVQLTFNDEGKDLFANLTQSHIGEPIAIFLDDQLITAPTVQSAILDGTAIITGGFDVKGAKQLAIQLNAGALPVPIHLIEEHTIGATLGTEAVRASLFAGVVGFLLVVLFMSLYYRLLGLLASIALVFYALFAIAVYKTVGVTFTLAGIAGFIISIGMAVDANVLIFERYREELRAGNPVNLAIEEGFRRAWSSIFDSNTSSIITALILYYTTTGLVRGFAVTLALGILVSMFTAVTVTRTFLRIVLRPGKAGEA